MAGSYWQVAHQRVNGRAGLNHSDHDKHCGRLLAPLQDSLRLGAASDVDPRKK